jgi:Protein of unknown function (DUF3574)
MRIACLAVCSLTLASATLHQAVAQPAPPSCHGTQQPKMVAELMFGRDIGVGRNIGVSESEWQRFVARELVSRFPDGLTIMDAVGQWRDHDGKIVHEPSKHVEIVLPGNKDDDTRLDAVVAAYKNAFHQHSVGVIVRPACVAF